MAQQADHFTPHHGDHRLFYFGELQLLFTTAVNNNSNSAGISAMLVQTAGPSTQTILRTSQAPKGPHKRAALSSRQPRPTRGYTPAAQARQGQGLEPVGRQRATPINHAMAWGDGET